MYVTPSRSSCSAMRSLSSTVRLMPSSCDPSRRVVSKISTYLRSSDMFVPVLVLVDLAAHGVVEDLLDLAGDGSGIADLAVVDRTDRHDLGGGAGEERLLRGVEVGADDVGLAVLDAEVAGHRAHRVLRDALERAGAHRRRVDDAVLDHEDVLAG